MYIGSHSRPTWWRALGKRLFPVTDVEIEEHLAEILRVEVGVDVFPDIHRETAMLLTGKPGSFITKEERQRAKTLNMSLLYGVAGMGSVVRAAMEAELAQVRAKASGDNQVEGE